jgi:hypothetical protein
LLQRPADAVMALALVHHSGDRQQRAAAQWLPSWPRPAGRLSSSCQGGRPGEEVIGRPRRHLLGLLSRVSSASAAPSSCRRDPIPNRCASYLWEKR